MVLMKSCGIIAEYNPFHNGHRYQLEQARKESKSDVMVVVMSGNFTQRGEPALVDKWTRAEMALRNGADLILEQSVLGSMQAADLFAKAGVRLLQQVGCDDLSFGAEDGTSEQFLDITQQYLEREVEIDHYFQMLRNDGRSYPAQMQEAVTTILGESGSRFSFWEPNNQLGFSYLKENAAYPNPMQPIVVKRRGAKHHESLNQDASFASGTALRQLLLSGETDELAKWMPANILELLGEAPIVSWEDYWPLLRYRIIMLEAGQLRQLYQVVEGIEHRLKKMVTRAHSFHQFIALVKNKRWTWTRLQRVCASILLGITPTQVNDYFQNPPAIRVLGFTEAGQMFMRQQKKERKITFISNVNQKNQATLAVELKADEIYQLGSRDRLAEQNYTRQPVRVGN